MSNNEEIKSGDVVYLKSGSPAMTVNVISGDKCYCVWFINGEAKFENFNRLSLTLDNPKS